MLDDREAPLVRRPTQRRAIELTVGGIEGSMVREDRDQIIGNIKDRTATNRDRDDPMVAELGHECVEHTPTFAIYRLLHPANQGFGLFEGQLQRLVMIGTVGYPWADQRLATSVGDEQPPPTAATVTSTALP